MAAAPLPRIRRLPAIPDQAMAAIPRLALDLLPPGPRPLALIRRRTPLPPHPLLPHRPDRGDDFGLRAPRTGHAPQVRADGGVATGRPPRHLRLPRTHSRGARGGADRGDCRCDLRALLPRVRPLALGRRRHGALSGADARADLLRHQLQRTPRRDLLHHANPGVGHGGRHMGARGRNNPPRVHIRVPDLPADVHHIRHLLQRSGVPLQAQALPRMHYPGVLPDVPAQMAADGGARRRAD
mmetsp:Transcript_29113/g.69440  ORF Transcript_29113/g.69440 Transcript_29113/m.69440 type:complete len:240 (-) Transcript_29113:669-1388(-)